ncbi:peptidase domain-containing ABC transporter [Bartonella sp. AC90GZZY]|uniref:peptidase domain-containing ABC transporter n=1 Tax=Bartonella sp. AC90GZZY TaxID=3243461 RepID=UPI0035CF0B5F
MSHSQEKPVAFSWFTRTTKKYIYYVIELSCVAVVLRLLGLVNPFIFQAIIDRILPFQRIESLYAIVVLMVAIMLFSTALSTLSGYLGAYLANRLTLEFGRRIYTHLLSLSLPTLRRWQVGELFSRIGEVDTIRGFLTGTITTTVLNVLFAIIYIVALFSISPKLTFIVLIILPLQMGSLALVGPFLRRQLRRSFTLQAVHKSRLIESFTNLEAIKAHVKEAAHTVRMQETLARSLDQSLTTSKLHLLNGAMSHIFGDLFTIFIIFFGAQAVLQNQITLGQLIAFHLLAGNVSGPILSLASLWEEWQHLKISRLRLGDILNSPPEWEEEKPPLQLSAPPHLEANDLCFSYGDKSIINHLDICLQPGQPIMLLGPSGCGKTTLAKLLCGLYPPTSGKILINAQPLQNFDVRSVRETIAYFPQNPCLFSGTILENMLLAKPDATKDEIDAALYISACHDLIAQLPLGLHTQVGEQGGFLSGGQRQRLALACFFLINPSLLILDEPTSALDDAVSAQIVEHLYKLSQDRIVLVITHKSDLFPQHATVLNFTDLEAKNGR